MRRSPPVNTAEDPIHFTELFVDGVEVPAEDVNPFLEDPREKTLQITPTVEFFSTSDSSTHEPIKRGFIFDGLAVVCEPRHIGCLPVKAIVQEPKPTTKLIDRFLRHDTTDYFDVRFLLID